MYREVRQGLVDMNTMFSLLNLKPKIVEVPDARTLIVQGTDINIKVSEHFEVFRNGCKSFQTYFLKIIFYRFICGVILMPI